MMNFGELEPCTGTLREPAENAPMRGTSALRGAALKDTLFDARYFDKFNWLADFEGGYIYYLNNDICELVSGFDYDGRTLTLYTDSGVYEMQPDSPLLYSLNDKRGQKFAPTA